MKTITMPLEDYERERLKAKTDLETRSYTKGGLDVLLLLRNELINPRSEIVINNNQELSKAIRKFVEDLESKQTQNQLRSSYQR